MNKQLTKKSIGIAASAALMATLAVSGSAFAHHNDSDHGNSDNGQKGSIEQFSVCYLEGKDLRVETDITNTSSNPEDLTVTSITVTAVEKYSGPWKPENWNYVGDPTSPAKLPTFINEAGERVETEHVTSKIPLCDSESTYPPVSLLARSVNAEIKVMIADSHKVETGFIARCSDDPDTPEDEVAKLNVWKQNICN